MALALDFAFDVLGPAGARTVEAADFFTGLWETAIGDGELLTGVRVPVWSGRCGFAVEEVARRHGEFAIAGAAVAIELGPNGRVVRCGIGLIGLGSTVRGTGTETQIVGRARTELDSEELGRHAVGELDAVPGDVHAPRTIAAGSVRRCSPKHSMRRCRRRVDDRDRDDRERCRRRAEVEPRLTLADFLRGRCGLTGTHLGCEHGVCGACTVSSTVPRSGRA